MYLVCGLDDESYAHPTFKFEEHLENANKLLVDLCLEFADGNDYYELTREGNRCTAKYEEGYPYNGEKFLVTEMFVVEDSAEYVLVYHHGYDGVDFNILEQGTFEECLLAKNKDIKKNFSEDEIEWEDGNQTCVDTGNEWCLWNILKVEV